MALSPTAKQLATLEAWLAEQEQQYLAPFYARLPTTLRRAFAVDGLDGLLRTYRDAMEQATPRRRKALERAVTKAAAAAVASFHDKLVQTYGATYPQVLLEVRPGAGLPRVLETLGHGAPERVVQQVNTQRDPWGQTWSQRLWKHDQQTRLEMQQYLQEHLRHGTAATQGAQGLLRFQVPDRELPRHLKRLEQAGRAALKDAPEARTAFLQALKLAKAEVAERTAGPLGTGTFQQVTIKKIEQALKTGSKATIDQAITYFAEQRGQYRALVLLRTETNRAFGLTSLETYRQQDFVLGVRWRLSGNHPHTDICDTRAHADGGLGPGVYPKDAVPTFPAHPSCRCTLLPVLMPPEELGTL